MIAKLNFHSAYYEAGSALPKRERLALWDALLAYAFEGTEPNLKGATLAVFIALKGRVDASVNGYRHAKGVEAEADEPAKAPCEGAHEAPCEGATDGTNGDPPRGEQPTPATVLEYKSIRGRGIDDEVIGARDTPAPTGDEVTAYFGANCLRGDPEAFFDFYEGQGWRKSNGMPVGDWRAVARSWSRRQAEIDAERAAKGEPPADQATFRPAKSDEEQLAELEAEMAARGWA